MATATRKALTFGVTCPKCHDPEAMVSLDLNVLSTCRCGGCDEEFSPREAVELFQAEARRWARVVSWIEMAADVAE